MQPWILIAVVAYLLFALNGIADKILLTKAVTKPAVYAFFTALMSPLVIVLAPFGFRLVPLDVLYIALAGGASFTFALYFLYISIRETTISRVMPLQGGLVPLFTLGLAYLILGETITGSRLLGFALLVIGAILVSFNKEGKSWHHKALAVGTLAAFLFALSFTLTKYVYGSSNFVSGLIWTRVGVFLAAGIFLFSKQTRRDIVSAGVHTSPKNIVLYYSARVAGAFAGLLQQYAIAIGSVVIVNALQGTQFVFLLGLTIVLSYSFPKILKEKITGLIILQKLLAIALVTVGLILIT